MQDLIKWFSRTFKSQKDNWDGNLDLFITSSAIIESKLSQDLFLWLLYPFQQSKDQNLDKGKLSKLGKIIFTCIDKERKCTSARILDYFNSYAEEDILYEIFNLVINGYIETTTED